MCYDALGGYQGMVAMDFSHVVVGGGCIGLATASRLARSHGSSSVLLIERHLNIGMETSSRNSEVIHAGLYYPVDSVKARLCVKGKKMLYDVLRKQDIPHRQTGKWVVAQDSKQVEFLNSLKQKADALGVPTRFLSSRECSDREPDIRCAEAALESPTTGIMDSHGLMMYLRGQFEEAGGEIALGTSVQAIEALGPGKGFRITTQQRNAPNEPYTFTTESVINSAGLAAAHISNLVVPEATGQEPLKLYYAKGQYFSYSGKVRPSRLIYPCPEEGLSGLGTHMTLDLGGGARFGPDVTWVDSPNDLEPDKERLQDVVKAVSTYLPSLQPDELQPAYAGIRPKLKPAGQAANDFVIRHEPQLEGFVNLLGIESPGLTASLAIAEEVSDLLR
ncbi:hypothetical protein PYCC9005_004259 [Savitreella phatthalungensis]